MISFNYVDKFEKKIAKFFGSKFGIATDSCTHSLELCLRLSNLNKMIFFPKFTYIGIPMLAIKLKIPWGWYENFWTDYYEIKNTNIIDAAVLWRKNSYVKGKLMCLSFQFQKHINIGRGGMILTDSEIKYEKLKKMSYDGRDRNIPWRDQNISFFGCHYYMTPENAKIGLNIFNEKKNKKPKSWNYKDYPDLSKMRVFKN